MQIGRNDDQAIQLDFGDAGISRSSHAVIAYDPEDRKSYLGHGGKANLVRLNGSPVLATVPLSSGDEIRISETTMRFVAFCDESFDWRDA
jgi:pSer/pThr/pTyr-binding forkhead associated (FHA) protein